MRDAARFRARSTSHTVAVPDGCTNIPLAAGRALPPKSPLVRNEDGSPQRHRAGNAAAENVLAVTAVQKFLRSKGLRFALPRRMSGPGDSRRDRKLNGKFGELPLPFHRIRTRDHQIEIWQFAHMACERRPHPVSREARTIRRADAFQIVEGGAQLPIDRFHRPGTGNNPPHATFIEPRTLPSYKLVRD